MQDILTEREAFVLRHRFGMSEDGRAKTLEVIGEALQVTRERVRQVEQKALPTPATHAILAQLKAGECIRHSI